MRINQEIKDILHRYGIPQNDGISYLLTVYFDVRNSYTPLALVQKVQATGILSLDDKTRTIDWNVTLFEEQVTGFGWVKDWMQLFADRNKERKGVLADVTRRMKEFFTEHIDKDITRLEVMEATKMYLKTVYEAKHVKTSHKFIKEGAGKSAVSMLMQWIELYRESLTQEQGRSGTHNSMQ